MSNPQDLNPIETRARARAAGRRELNKLKNLFSEPEADAIRRRQRDAVRKQSKVLRSLRVMATLLHEVNRSEERGPRNA